MRGDAVSTIISRWLAWHDRRVLARNRRWETKGKT